MLVPDLLQRLREDVEESPGQHRQPGLLTVKWRKAGSGWGRSSASTAWPIKQAAAASLFAPRRQAAGGGGDPGSSQSAAAPAAAAPSSSAAAAALTASATALLKQHLPATGFCLTLLNIGATGFKTAAADAGGIHRFLVQQQQQQQANAAAAASAAPPLSAAAGTGPALAGDSMLLAARAATAAWRDYTAAADGGVALLSKRQERQLWELGLQQQAKTPPSLPRAPQPPWRQQEQQAPGAARHMARPLAPPPAKRRCHDPGDPALAHDAVVAGAAAAPGGGGGGGGGHAPAWASTNLHNLDGCMMRCDVFEGFSSDSE